MGMTVKMERAISNKHDVFIPRGARKKQYQSIAFPLQIYELRE